MASFKFSPSSSSSIPKGGWKYDVFLSFRGEDTRLNFVDHLYVALVQRGILVFKDDEMLHKGEEISLEIMTAIEESKFAVVIISKNYANSSWCLVELAKIIECHNCLGQKVLPVFYHVDPSDVRAQTKDFGIALEQHEQKFTGEKDKVNTWREALSATAGLSGLHISNTIKEGESTYINKIVQEILGDLRTFDTQNNLVGIESRVDEFQPLLDVKAKDEVRMVGIYGMGGIGKTTLAQALFRRISCNFGGSSFVKDVRENSSSKRDICALQEKVLREILMTNHKFNIQDPEDGAKIIRTRFIHKCILLVLDDVDNGKQLEFLAATHHWLGPGSRIIITTRNEQLLSDTNAKYKPSYLSKDDALELFSRHAFKKNSPPDGYGELSFRAISYAGYLPLAVKVLGSFFRGRKADIWESAFNRLAKKPNDEIFETLKLSFDALEDSEKNIFLDIACFFKGKNAGHVTRVLDGCGFDPLIGITVLVEKSLITISNKGLEMHDLIQEMGWEVVRQSFPNSRLWQLNEIQDFIRRTKKLKAVEAIVVQDKQNDDDPFEEANFSTDIFVTMKNLRLLDVKGKFTFCEPTFLPDELRWICWNEYPFSSLPIGNLRKLVGIEVAKGSIKQFWKGQKIMPNLKFVKLQRLDCLTRIPDVSGAPNIERLVLLNCKNLVEVHESLGSHKKLVKWDMIGCERLRHLPSRIEMESFKVLRLSKCYTLERFPEVSPSMTSRGYR
uniref:disease resistance protein Roq1-like isoform X2 n=1 Tax=Erigeron canadensis TaxID=72917 RepID=UPI001CB97B8B|nr:disease resistance protein Roq1-like isoform X2 [Erigeron canadensis]